MLIENGISEAAQFFHIDALSSMVGMKVDFDMQLTLVASSLHRMMAQRIGKECRHSQAKTVFRNLLNPSRKVEITGASVVAHRCRRLKESTMAEPVKRKTMIVTGASQGIGAGVTKAFIERGYNVVANSRKITESEFAPTDRLVLVDGNIGEVSTAAKISQ
jgi:hypothetical protein